MAMDTDSFKIWMFIYDGGPLNMSDKKLSRKYLENTQDHF